MAHDASSRQLAGEERIERCCIMSCAPEQTRPQPQSRAGVDRGLPRVGPSQAPPSDLRLRRRRGLRRDRRWPRTERTCAASSFASGSCATSRRGRSPPRCWAKRSRCRSSSRPVGFGGMLARRAEVQAAKAAERAGIPFCESTLSICGGRRGRGRDHATDLVPALRDEGPQLRRGPDGAGPGGRLHDVGPDRRPARRRSALPRRAQRHQREDPSHQAAAPRRRPLHPHQVGARRRARRSAPDVREPREGAARRQRPG